MTLTVGLLADIQYADLENSNTEGRCQRYRESPGKLQQAVNSFIALDPQLACVLTLGDIINGQHETQERDIQDLNLVLHLLQPLAARQLPVHNTFGNHCLSLPREYMLKRLGMPASFYAVDLAPGWRLLVLDTTEMSGHSGKSKDAHESKEAQAYWEAHPLSEAEPHMQSWNGGIGAQQMRWLHHKLQEADRQRMRVICTCHHQIGPGAARATHMAWNFKDIMDVVLQSSCVTLVLSGHDHIGGYACIQGKHFVTLEALLEAPTGSSAFAIMELDDSAIVARHLSRLVQRTRYILVACEALETSLLLQQKSYSQQAHAIPQDGRTLQDFLRPVTAVPLAQASCEGLGPSISGKRVFIETYGCQMNTSDSEVVLSVLQDDGYTSVDSPEEADVILVNTCAIREHAESRVFSRLGIFKQLKARRQADDRDAGVVVGVLGCMAERLQQQLLSKERSVDLVVGPDAYRDLPRLLSSLSEQASTSGAGSSGVGAHDPSSSSSKTKWRGSLSLAHAQQPINVTLSRTETYEDVEPARPQGQMSAWLSIMRGCDNLCAFCIVPFTRGRERSRPLPSIIDEVQRLSDSGFKEVTLLGQNVNSYADFSHVPGSRPVPDQQDPFAAYAQGFSSVYKPRRQGAKTFADLLHEVADVDPEMRIRFMSPHPKDFGPDVLQAIAEHANVAKQLHLPAQSGSSSLLQRMRRGHTREAYDALVDSVRAAIPGIALSTDIIAGFCGETEEEHFATVDLVKRMQYDQAFMFAYSQRTKTFASRHLPDDVPPDVKTRRLTEIIAAFRSIQAARNQAEIGRIHLVLVEGPARRQPDDLTGKTCSMKRVGAMGGGQETLMARSLARNVCMADLLETEQLEELRQWLLA
ncbi:hypothetical protein WJX84_012363 [Apatococcus fuscideae]|uniref:Uncharacterized protein n=1 Tax=Apatococcus fuscideae TaxID=2026836 RepID=A0AAW1SNT1_9CHLO